ncbi:hypothetical protein COCOR_01273 [Corallococcus coralloides DSM 2259]|uniref:Uncharacterized protein n=1 Tax=Corallococcus coralloides (strain ATCC 25202 / DSM 2259 / NBRC 100086 / M2) TaxID=1144275 RepID=H8MS22_CORCM|nr:hypothetical protein [Corallococcus coralloides]AFE03978.1 hypothetical protein COCOR_01273 [Corallococcus coralloides DSM 2259]
MRPAPCWLLLFALAAGVPASAQQSPPSKEVPAPAKAVPPEASPPPTEARRPQPPLTDEDREVVENLELLESLDAAADLEVLLELADEQ